MKVFAVVLISLICVSGLVFVAYFIGVTSDDRRLDIERETALIRAEAERDATRADGQVKVISAQTRLEQAKLSSDPQIRQAMRTRAYLSAWFPVYFPVLLFAGVSILTAVYYTFRLVEYKDESIQTKVRVFDSAKLVDRSLQVKAIEAAQGVDVLQLAENISHRQLSAFGGMVRGLRGILGSKEVPAVITPQAALPSAVYPVPSFSESVNDMRPDKIVLGYKEGQAVYFDMPDFVSCGFAGASGSGKTSKMRFLLSQLAINGIKLHILDAHAGDKESLVNSLGDICKLSNVKVHSPIETRETINFFLEDLQAAIRQPDKKTPTIYVIDELLPIVDAVPDTAKMILKTATEGRKFERYIFAAGQVWPASLFQKGSSVRDSLTLRMSAKNDELQARLLFKTREKAKIVEGLKLPQMFANSMKFQGVVDVPFCTRDDMNIFAAKVLPKETQQQAHTQPMESTPETMEEIDSLTDAQLIARVNLKRGMMGNNEFARHIGQDEGLTSKSLRGLSLPLFPAMRSAFQSFLKAA